MERLRETYTSMSSRARRRAIVSGPRSLETTSFLRGPLIVEVARIRRRIECSENSSREQRDNHSNAGEAVSADRINPGD